MSLFKTTIPVDVKTVLDKLPARSYVQSVIISADRSQVEVHWGCDDLKTGLTFPVEYRLEDLLNPTGKPPYQSVKPPVKPDNNVKVSFAKTRGKGKSGAAT